MNFTLTFSDKEMDYIGNVLAARPYGEVVQLLNNIQRQLQEQQAGAIGAAAQAHSGLNGATPSQ